MSNPLSLTSSFCTIWPVIDNRAEWDRLVNRTCSTLSSLSQIGENTKYYFYEKDSQFYKSTFWITDTLKNRGWIGNATAGYIGKYEEGAYRTCWRLSHNDAMEGLYRAKSEIMGTLLMARGSLEPDVKKLDIRLDSLELDIKKIYQLCHGANDGIRKLARTYETDPAKQDVLMPAVEAFCTEINEFVINVLALIKKVQTGKILASEQKFILNPLFPVPFLNSVDENQIEFNENLQNNYTLMKKYVECNQDQLAEMKKTRKYQCISKNQVEDRPWAIEVTATRNIYFDYGISIVPPGEGGAFKDDRRGFSVTRNADVAKLTMKPALTYEKERENRAAARTEERFLTLFMEKNFPNIVETFDIFWERDVQFIYQRYYVHGSLDSSLKRLNNEPEKKKAIMIDVLKGLSYLHAEGIVHRDIKPGNILLDQDDTGYLADFGLSCYLSEDRGSFRGSPHFVEPGLFVRIRSPSINWNVKLTCATDIWAFGMTMYGLLKNSIEPCPWPWLKDAKHVEDVPTFTKLNLNATFPEPRKDDPWWHSCWKTLRISQEDRPTAQQLLDQLKNTIKQSK